MKKSFIIIGAAAIILLALETIFACIFKARSEYLESLYYISQIINCIVVALGVVYAAWQYYLSLTDSKRQSDI